MNQRYDISQGADRDTLTALHNEILAVNPSIRPVNRWGRFTEYSIKLKRREVVDIIGALPDGDERVWRLVIGVEHDAEGGSLTVDVQYYDRDQRLWESVFAESASDDPALERAVAWASTQHPATEALVEIDGRLLMMERA